jgi:hypothetical protein
MHSCHVHMFSYSYVLEFLCSLGGRRWVSSPRRVTPTHHAMASLPPSLHPWPLLRPAGIAARFILRAPRSPPPRAHRHFRPAKSGYRLFACGVTEERERDVRVGDERERGGAVVAVSEIVGQVDSSAAAERCRCRGRTSAAWARTPGSSATSAATVRTHRLSSIASQLLYSLGWPMNGCLTQLCSFLHRDTQGYAEAGQGQGDQERMEGTH